LATAGNKIYVSASDLPETVPIFPLTGALLLPGGQLPLNIFEPRYLSMIDDAIASERIIGMVQPCLKPENADTQPCQLTEVGCLGRITAFQESGDGRYLLSLSGICRYRITKEIASNKAYRTCAIEVFEEDLGDQAQAAEQISRDRLIEAFRNYLNAQGMEADWSTIEKTDNDTLLTALCMMCPYDPAEKQALLEAPDLKSRSETLIAISEIHLAREAGQNKTTLQ